MIKTMFESVWLSRSWLIFTTLVYAVLLVPVALFDLGVKAVIHIGQSVREWAWDVRLCFLDDKDFFMRCWKDGF